MKSEEEILSELTKLELLTITIDEKKNYIAALTMAGIALGLAWVAGSLIEAPSSIVVNEFLGGKGGEAKN